MEDEGWDGGRVKDRRWKVEEMSAVTNRSDSLLGVSRHFRFGFLFSLTSLPFQHLLPPLKKT